MPRPVLRKGREGAADSWSCPAEGKRCPRGGPQQGRAGAVQNNTGRAQEEWGPATRQASPPRFQSSRSAAQRRARAAGKCSPGCHHAQQDKEGMGPRWNHQLMAQRTLPRKAEGSRTPSCVLRSSPRGPVAIPCDSTFRPHRPGLSCLEPQHQRIHSLQFKGT